MDNEITAIQVVEQASRAASRLAVAADLGAKMKCEFCQGRGRGFDETRVVSWPCPECNGTGLQHCCEGLVADPVVDGEPEDEEEKTEICNVCDGSGMGYHGPDSVCRTCGGDGEICVE